MSDSFFIEKAAREYFMARFPNASLGEQKREIQDWIFKVKKSHDLVKDFKNRIGDPRNLSILDAGSGNGGISIAFAEAGAKVMGVDIEKDLIDIARKHSGLYHYNLPPEFLLYDGIKLPFADVSFDMAISVSVLEHVDDPVNYLREIWRILKSGGKLYLALPNRLWPKETHTGLWFITFFPRNLGIKIVKLLGRNPLEANNLHFYTFWELKSILNFLRKENRNWKVFEETGSSRNIFKLIIKKILKFLNIPYQAVLPHIMIILEKE